MVAATWFAISASSPVSADDQPVSADDQIKDDAPTSDDLEIEDLTNMSIEELLNIRVVSASGTEERAHQAAANITVLTREDFHRWGYRSVADALRHTLGFYVIEDHILFNAGLRGISAGLRGESNLIKLMIDGREVSFRSTGGNWLGPELIPLRAVDRIEIVRGPVSALYGANAFLGIINVITRTGTEMKGAEMSTSGSYALGLGYDHDVALGTRMGKLDLLASFRVQSEDRSGLRLPDSSPAPRIPDYRGQDEQSRYLTSASHVALAKAIYHASDVTSVSATTYLSAVNRGGEFADWTQLSHGIDPQGRDRGTRVALAHGYGGLELKTKFGEKLDVSLDGVAFSGAPTKEDRLEIGSDLFYARRRIGFRGVNLAATASWLPVDSLSFRATVDSSYDSERVPTTEYVLMSQVGDRQAGDAHAVGTPTDGVDRNRLINTGGFVNAVWKRDTFRGLRVTGGLRFDRNNVYGNQVSGRLVTVVNPVSRLHCKLLYGNAFRAPSPLLLYGVPVAPGDIIGNRALMPQRIHTFEGQVSYALKGFLNAQSSVAYSYLKNQAVFVRERLNNVARNLAWVSTLSWETRVDLRPSRAFNTYASLEYHYVVRNDKSAGYRRDLVGTGILAHPALTLHAGVLGTTPWIPVRVVSELSYIGPRRASAANILESGSSYEIDPRLELGAALTYSDLELLADRKTEISLVGRNLLGSTSPDPGFAGVEYPYLPRTILLTWRQEL